jgi:thioredoxin 1
MAEQAAGGSSVGQKARKNVAPQVVYPLEAVEGAGEGMSSVMHVTSEDFSERVLASELPVVVDFWAAWCGPCLMMAPEFEALAEEMAGVAAFAKLNVDEHPDISQRYDVAGIPTLIVFADGEVQGRLVGFAPREHIRHSLEHVLLDAAMDPASAAA